MSKTLSKNQPLSTNTIEKVARKEGVDPTELRTPLYDVIDPDALDSLFTNGSGQVTFEYLQYQITVKSNGQIFVVPLDKAER